MVAISLVASPMLFLTLLGAILKEKSVSRETAVPDISMDASENIHTLIR